MDCNEISCLTLKTKEIALEVEGANLWIDFAKILKCRDDVYINATPIAKKFNSGVTHELKPKNRKYNIRDYLKLDQTVRYIEALEHFLNRADSPQLESKTVLAKHDLVYKKTGRYGGTWLHRKLFLNFARWLSPEFEIICDQILEQVIMQADELKESRDILRKLQRPLNDVIKQKLVDTGIKNDKAYMQFAVMIRRMIGNPDDRDHYTKTQLNAARQIIEEYRAMIVYGKETSLKEMNKILQPLPMNLAWKK